MPSRRARTRTGVGRPQRAVFIVFALAAAALGCARAAEDEPPAAAKTSTNDAAGGEAEEERGAGAEGSAACGAGRGAAVDFSSGGYREPEIWSLFSREEVDLLSSHATDPVAPYILDPHDPDLDRPTRALFERMVERLGPGYTYDDLYVHSTIHTHVVREEGHNTVQFHNDACCDDECAGWYKEYGNGRQRRTGILTWLSDDYEGGIMDFVNFGLKIRGPPGWAIKFDLLTEGTLHCHDLAVHRAQPVTKGIKRVMTTWLLAPYEWMEARPGPRGYNATLARGPRRSRGTGLVGRAQGHVH